MIDAKNLFKYRDCRFLVFATHKEDERLTEPLRVYIFLDDLDKANFLNDEKMFDYKSFYDFCLHLFKTTTVSDLPPISMSSAITLEYFNRGLKTQAVTCFYRILSDEKEIIKILDIMGKS